MAWPLLPRAYSSCSSSPSAFAEGPSPKSTSSSMVILPRRNATDKLKHKQLDLIVANDISAKDAGFATHTNRVTLLKVGGDREELPLMAKSKVAEVVMERIEQLLPDMTN